MNPARDASELPAPGDWEGGGGEDELAGRRVQVMGRVQQMSDRVQQVMRIEGD